ncbi:hypothetical protein KAFR_0E03290 [Kazachstania africana CBS 2517]|uniref:BZIP domain-containing protein n=1 Tax=Kazachstania africana (strain ATCC 22294 / BCRC 22015 / CBS 2517 / CECT 1963 / NBRC 1671 / NRRL Y-8276) TaxID=1071382 RepID=H2AVT1_KAZAF|nr:hypothetical protein KAFR_0E03290 [Kazachstania africana CBS 2517]CCF58481.1 hypothetical protein KAFR_0E03290 [Kazachstania africana CBS 2517]
METEVKRRVGRPGRKKLDADAKNKRTQQNRMAQRAFRERKEAKLKLLENEVDKLQLENLSKAEIIEFLKQNVMTLLGEIKNYRKQTNKDKKLLDTIGKLENDGMDATTLQHSPVSNYGSPPVLSHDEDDEIEEHDDEEDEDVKRERFQQDILSNTWTENEFQQDLISWTDLHAGDVLEWDMPFQNDATAVKCDLMTNYINNGMDTSCRSCSQCIGEVSLAHIKDFDKLCQELFDLITITEEPFSKKRVAMISLIDLRNVILRHAM